MTDRSTRLALFGYLAPGVSLGAIVIATVVDPLFSWRTRSLSSMGEATGTGLLTLSADQAAFAQFNGGLVLAGVLGAPFVYVLWRDATTRLERLGAGLYGLTGLSMVGVGIAYLDGPVASLHFLAALGVFFGLTVTLWVHGTGLARRTGGTAGLGAIWMANAHALLWVLWIMAEAFAFTGDGDTWTYFAVPEFVGAVLFGVWVALQARRVRRAATA